MKLRFFAVALVLGAVAASIGPANAATQHHLVMSGIAYQAGTCGTHSGTGDLTVLVGDSVQWTNCDGVQHSVTWTNNAFPEQVVDPASNAQQAFASAGMFPYHCKFHATMTGTIKVNAAATTTTAKPTTTTAKPTTTVKPTTTSPSTSTSTTQTTLDLNGVFGDEEATTSSSSSTTSTTRPDKEDNGDGGSAAIVALLLLAIAGVGIAAFGLARRMRRT